MRFSKNFNYLFSVLASFCIYVETLSLIRCLLIPFIYSFFFRAYGFMPLLQIFCVIRGGFCFSSLLVGNEHSMIVEREEGLGILENDEPNL